MGFPRAHAGCRELNISDRQIRGQPLCRAKRWCARGERCCCLLGCFGFRSSGSKGPGVLGGGSSLTGGCRRQRGERRCSCCASVCKQISGVQPAFLFAEQLPEQRTTQQQEGSVRRRPVLEHGLLTLRAERAARRREKKQLGARCYGSSYGVDSGSSSGSCSLVSIHTFATRSCISVYSSKGSFGSLERETPARCQERMF